MSFTIELERPEDIEAIRAIEVAAFGRANEAAIVDALREHDHVMLSLVARTVDGRIVGHVLFSLVTIERDDVVVDRGVGLGPLAVRPAHQNTGVGSALARAGLDACRQRGQPWCVVLGDPMFYSRFGFARALDAGIANEFSANEAFMIVALGSAKLPSGVARYGAEFHT